MTRQRWQSYSMRSVYGGLLPAVEVTETHGQWSARQTGGLIRVKQQGVEVVPVKRFYGLTRRQALRRATRWLYR